MAWFKRNRNEAPAEDTADGAAAPEPPGGDELAAETPPAPAGPAAEPVTAPPAWTTAPPMPSVIPTIQRALGRIEARSATTLGRPAPLSLAPLGHAVTPDAPAGVVGTLTLADHGHHEGPALHDGPPLDYVQRAPAGAVPPRPPAPAQLLVPSYQPSHLPQIPVATPEVQRAPSSFTTAPDPTPPLVLPVGEVLSPPVAAAPVAPVAPVEAAPAAPADAPLLAGPAAPAPAAPGAPAPGVQRAPAAELPLAPVQRHADHPGHVDGDEAPVEAEVQRAAIDAPAAAAEEAPDAPLLAGSPLIPSIAGPSSPETSAAPVEATAAPASDLPLAPVQRHADHADHPGHVDGDEPPAEAVDAGDVQRAALDAPAPMAPPPPAPDAPLLGDAAPLGASPIPEAAAPETTGAVAPGLPLPGPPVQRSAAPRRPVGLGAPIAAIPTAGPGAIQKAPLAAPPAGTPTPTAPLVGDAPLPATPALPLAAVQRAATHHDADHADHADHHDTDTDDTHDTGDTHHAAGEGSGTSSAGVTPPLDLAQRAPADPGAPASPPATEEATTPDAPLLGQSPIEPAIGAAPGAAPAPAGADVPATGPRPDLELVQRAPLAAAGSSAPTSAATSAPTSSSAATPAAAALPPLVVAPLLGGRPFATQVQRAAAGATAPAGPVDRSSPEALSPEPGRVYQPLAGIGVWNGAPPPDLPGPAVEAPPAHIASAVQRATGTDVSNTRIRRDTGPTVQRLDARAFTSEGEVHIPASVGSLSSGEGASLATHELVHVGQQSVLGSSRPSEHTPEGQHLEAQARSAEHASLAGLELPKLPLAPAAPAVQRASAENGGSSPFSPQQLDTLMTLANNPPSSEMSVQRESTAPPRPSTPAPGGIAPVDPSELPAMPPGSPSRWSNSPEPPAQTPQELEELATKLFPTLRNLFRSELLGFRRRSGTSADRPLS